MALGCDALHGRAMKLMKRAGVAVEIFRFVHFSRINFRTHRKILVIDGTLGFIGGVGIADDWKGNGRTHGLWRDTHYEVRGPVVAQTATGFHGQLAGDPSRVATWRSFQGKFFRGSFVALIVPEASTNLTANLTVGEIRRVHVRIGPVVAHGFQSGIEVTYSNALARGSGDIYCRDRPSNASRSCRRTGRLAATAAQEDHNTTSDFAGREVQVSYTQRRRQIREVQREADRAWLDRHLEVSRASRINWRLPRSPH